MIESGKLAPARVTTCEVLEKNIHKFRERGLPAYSRQGNFASCGALRAARSSLEIPHYLAARYLTAC
jgi:hypothetical protein